MAADTAGVGVIAPALEPVRGRRPGAPLRARQSLLSDEALARRVAAGERDAFSAIYERYRVPLSRYCRSIVHDREEAADALQNAMLAALAGLEREAPSGPLAPWLYRVAHNASIDLIRRRARRPEELVAEAPDLDDLEAPAEVSDQIRALFADLAELPERQRGALLMRELAGLEYDQIGRVFATSAVAARKLVYEARVSLSAQREGRSSRCESVLAQLSDGDGRTARGRVIRAHISSCEACAAFERSLRVRREQFALIPALPVLGGGLWLTVTAGGGAGATKALAGAGVAAGSTAVSAGAGVSAGGALSGAAVSGAGGAIAAAKCLAVCGALAVAGAGTAIVAHPQHARRAPIAHAPTVHRTHAAALSRTALASAPAARVSLPARVDRVADTAAHHAARAGTGVPTATGPATSLQSRRHRHAATTSSPPAPLSGAVGTVTAPASAVTTTPVSSTPPATPAPSAPAVAPPSLPDPAAATQAAVAQAAALASSASQAASSAAAQLSSSVQAMWGALTNGAQSPPQNSSN